MKNLRIAAALALTLSLAACGGEGGHVEFERAPGQAASSAGLPKGNVEAGARLVTTAGSTGQACVECHGADGNTPNAADVPLIGGQFADYIAHALQMYRDSVREHPLMTNQATHLTDQQIADAAAYYSSQPSQLTDLSALR
ncbi:c-type cytochrome [Luteimonas sp. e5]